MMSIPLGLLRRDQSRPARLRVKLAALFGELAGLLFHPLLQRFFLGDALFGGVFTDVFGDVNSNASRRLESKRAKTYAFE